MTQTIRFIKPSDLKATVRGLAIMSALFDERRDYRFWSVPSIGCDLGVWRNNAGYYCYFLFAPKGSAILGFDPESPMSPRGKSGEEYKAWPGIYDSLPADLLDLVKRNPFGDEFKFEEVTFCVWNATKGFDWKKGKIEYPKRDTGDPDGSRFILNRFKEYFDNFDDEMDEEFAKNFDPDTLFTVFSGDAVSTDDLLKLKPDMDVATVRAPLKEIGVSV